MFLQVRTRTMFSWIKWNFCYQLLTCFYFKIRLIGQQLLHASALVLLLFLFLLPSPISIPQIWWIIMTILCVMSREGILRTSGVETEQCISRRYETLRSTIRIFPILRALCNHCTDSRVHAQISWRDRKIGSSFTKVGETLTRRRELTVSLHSLVQTKKTSCFVCFSSHEPTSHCF